MPDEGFHEIQLNGKQLVFLFMAGRSWGAHGASGCGRDDERGRRTGRGRSADLRAVRGDASVDDTACATR